MRRLTGIVFCLALLGTAAVQAQEGQMMDPAAMEELMKELMTPGDQHALLGQMAGEWKTTMFSYMEGPEPVKSEGTFTSEAVLGGRYMVGRYTGISMGMPFEGMSIDGYDKGREQFFSIWIDNFGTGYYLAHGEQKDDGSLAHSGVMTFGPMEIPSRSETVFKDENTVVFTMWHTMGATETKAMELIYER